MNNIGFVIVPYAASYFLFFALVSIARVQNAHRLWYNNGFAKNLSTVLIVHIAGILLFGALPFFSNHFSPPILYDSSAITRWQSLVMIILIVLTVIISPRLANKEFRLNGNESSMTASPGNSFFIVYFIVRILFIVAYESWFRGFLLSDCAASFGIVISIFLNVSLYTLLHAVNGKKEMLSCIPFGFLLSCLCIWQGAVWPAIGIHLSLSIPYEASMIRKINTKRFAI